MSKKLMLLVLVSSFFPAMSFGTCDNSFEWDLNYCERYRDRPEQFEQCLAKALKRGFACDFAEREKEQREEERHRDMMLQLEDIQRQLNNIQMQRYGY